MKSFLTVLKKELVDVFRDRRTIFIAFVVGPVLMPALMGGMLYMMASKQVEKAEESMELPVIGAEHAPNLINFLETLDIKAKEAPANPEAAIKAEDEELILRIPESFASHWKKSEPAPLELIFDSSRRDTNLALKRLNLGIQAYGQQVGTTRLMLRGVSPSIMQAVRVDEYDLATPEAKSSAALSFIPYFLILGTFLGGAYVAMDATAGERERQSLEPLLATSASRESIMSGKLTAAALYGIVATILTLIMFIVAFKLLPQEKMGMSITLDLPMALRLLVLCVPIAIMGSTVLTLLSARAKSMKEAQSHMNWLMLIPMLPTFYLMLNPAKTELWQMLVPILGENQLIMRVLRAEPTTLMEWGVCVASSLAISAVIWFLAVKLYHKEQLAISG